MNLIMKKRAKYFKSMAIRYMTKGNEALKKQLVAHIASCAPTDSNESLTKIVPATYKNIVEKMQDIRNWFDRNTMS